MLRLKREQRRVLVDKLPDAANVAAGALVFGQTLSDRRFSVTLAVVGFFLWLGLHMAAMRVAGTMSEDE
jgi:hypothetical protein